jgi:hypothetical protein
VDWVEGFRGTKPGIYGPINSTDMQGATWALTHVCVLGLPGRQGVGMGKGDELGSELGSELGQHSGACDGLQPCCPTVVSQG